MFTEELNRLRHVLNGAGSVLITSTEREDGDSIAAELALRLILTRAYPGPRPIIQVINANPCPARFHFLPGADTIQPITACSRQEWDVGIVVDCGADRTGPVGDLFRKCPTQVKIDHHPFGNAGHSDIELCTDQVASTTEVLCQFLDHPRWRTPLDPALAELLYVGILCDTGAFRYDLTRPSTHRVAARLIETGFDFPRTAERVHLSRSFEMKILLRLVLERMVRAPHGRLVWSVVTEDMRRTSGAQPGDIGDIIDELCFIDGIEVSALFVEQSPSGTVRVSLRSKGGVNVGQLARQLVDTGGGHPRAAGCMLPGRLGEVAPAVCARIDRELHRAGLIPPDPTP